MNTIDEFRQVLDGPWPAFSNASTFLHERAATMSLPEFQECCELLMESAIASHQHGCR